MRLASRSPDGSPVFVGIGRERDVDRYLAGVARRRGRRHRPPTLPRDLSSPAWGCTVGAAGTQTFWAASAHGAGDQRLQWDLAPGRWVVVVMNANASRGVGADVSVGVKADWVLPLGIGLLGGFAVLLILGTILLVVGAAGLGRRIPAPPDRRAASGPPHGSVRPAAEPMAVAREVDLADPPLHRARSVVVRVLGRHGHRRVRDPVHRPVSPRPLRLQRRGAALDLAGRVLFVRARSGPIATHRSPSATRPTIRRRSRSGTPNGSRAASCS